MVGPDSLPETLLADPRPIPEPLPGAALLGALAQSLADLSGPAELPERLLAVLAAPLGLAGLALTADERGGTVRIGAGLAPGELEEQPPAEAGVSRRAVEGRPGVEALSVPLGAMSGSLVLVRDRPQELSAAERALLEALGGIVGLVWKQTRALLAAEEALRHSQEAAERMSIVDSLSGLYNGRHFLAALEAEVERARRYGDQLGLLLLDIDDFQGFNDRHGREAGDEALARLGRVMRQHLRKIDSAFRYGGEEFMVILPRCDEAGLRGLGERIRGQFAREEFQKAPAERLTVSVGAALYQRGAAIEAFIRGADRALYQAKAAGKNRVVLTDPPR